MVWYAGLNTPAATPPAATEATLQGVLAASTITAADVALIRADMAAIRARQYDKADHKELQPGDSLTLPVGTYHKVSWSVAPTDRNNPDLNQNIKVSIGGNTVRYFANEAGTYKATELDALDIVIGAGDARAVVIWEF